MDILTALFPYSLVRLPYVTVRSSSLYGRGVHGVVLSAVGIGGCGGSSPEHGPVSVSLRNRGRRT